MYYKELTPVGICGYDVMKVNLSVLRHVIHSQVRAQFPLAKLGNVESGDSQCPRQQKGQGG